MPQTRVRFNDLEQRYHLVLVDDNLDVLVDMGSLNPSNTATAAGIETILPETFNPFSDGSILFIKADGTKRKFSPAGNTAKDRGLALDAAAAASQNGDTVILNPFHYEVGKTISWAANRFTLVANGATIIRNTVPTDRVFTFNTGVSSSNKIFVYDLNVNGNGDNISLDGERGEGIQVTGSGLFKAFGCFAYNAPVGNTACNFYFDLADGHIILIGCTADDPGWANYRIRSRSFEAYACNSYVTTHKSGAKARFWDMDGQNYDEVKIAGGRWFSDQSYEKQCVFDPGPGNSCRSLSISQIEMNCYNNHVNATGDSLIKFDLVENVLVSDLTESHVQPRLQAGFDPYTHGQYETLFNIGLCGHVKLQNIQADATPHPASPDDATYCENLIIDNCIFGKNSKLDHAMWNLNMIKNTIIRNTSFLHVTGTGSQASGNNCIFNNGSSSTKNQKVILDNVTIGYKFTEVGTLFRHIREIGHVQFGNFTQLRETGSAGLIVGPNPSQRLMAAVRMGDPLTALLQFSPVEQNLLDDTDANTQRFAPIGTTTWAHDVKAPANPGTASGDWFGGTIIGKPGARVRNLNYGNGGNGFPKEFVKTSGGTFVDD
ncbi:MAG: hypothetical protein IPM51_11875 [Sphingobacteriaceae bacterium]|nr:hypothetical protein [Sphingobacteriaceae bacterium]